MIIFYPISLHILTISLKVLYIFNSFITLTENIIIYGIWNVCYHKLAVNQFEAIPRAKVCNIIAWIIIVILL